MGTLVNHYQNRDDFVQPCSNWVIRQQEEQMSEIQRRIQVESHTIELIIAHQRAMGNGILTIDNVTARAVNNLVTEYSHLKQDTLTAADKRIWQWASVALNVIGGTFALGSVPAGALITAEVGTFCQRAYEAGSAFAKGSETVAGIADSNQQKKHAIIDNDTQHLRTQKDAVMQSENRMKSSNDSVIQMLAKYYEALYQLRIALARMT